MSILSIFLMIYITFSILESITFIKAKYYSKKEMLIGIFGLLIPFLIYYLFPKSGVRICFFVWLGLFVFLVCSEFKNVVSCLTKAFGIGTIGVFLINRLYKDAKRPENEINFSLF